MTTDTLVHVTFLDVQTGKHIAHSQMPPEQLPDSFEAATTLEIQGKTFEVVGAKPVTKAEFVPLGRLTLELRERLVQTMDPKDILFSLPTISEDLPHMSDGSTKDGKRVLELLEDDWRQVELIHTTLRPEVNETFQAIQRIYDEKRSGPGFTEIHVRKLIPQPLPGDKIEVSALKELLDPKTGFLGKVFGGSPQLDGIAIHRTAGLVENGFAFLSKEGPGWYGLATGGRVVVLGLHAADLEQLPEATAAVLGVLCARFELAVVDWVRVALWEAGPGGALRRVRRR